MTYVWSEVDVFFCYLLCVFGSKSIYNAILKYITTDNFREVISFWNTKSTWHVQNFQEFKIFPNRPLIPFLNFKNIMAKWSEQLAKI